MDEEVKVWVAVGIECCTIGDGSEAIGLLFPTGVEQECETRHMTLPAAKALLIDLRAAIAACEAHQQNGR